MRTYYIYKATNKINGKSYIGQTINYKNRLWQHRRCYEKEDCKFHDAIKEFGFDNFEWEVIETCERKEEADNLERKYIELFDSYRNGYNENKGSVGGHNAKSIVCLNLNGDFIKRYDSAADAEKDGFNNVNVLLCCKNKLKTCKNHLFMFEEDYDAVQEASEKSGANRTTISGVLSKTYKSANGFIFVYEDDFPIKDLSVYYKKKKGRKIAQVDIKSGEIIDVYERISDAGKILGVNYKGIQKVVDKPERTAFGYKWISQ